MWFLLVLHWAMDVIYDFYYIHGPMESINQSKSIYCVKYSN